MTSDQAFYPRHRSPTADGHAVATPLNNGPIGYECAKCGGAVTIFSTPAEDSNKDLRAGERAAREHPDSLRHQRVRELDALMRKENQS